ncbi:MAG: uracil-DNA glycosylase [Myxococcota bacterium]
MSAERTEALELVRSARALVAEWVEDGLEPAAPESAKSTTRGAATRTPTADPTPATRPAAPPPLAPEAPRSPSSRPLAAVREDLGECTRCRLSEGRTQIVFGDGDPDADLMFIGEGPGEQEDLQGVPFVGRAGELLTKMIEAGLGIERRTVYICNIVKCRPPGNRNPAADEVDACRGFLDGQIDAVSPRAIVTLGKPAASLLLGREVAITRIRGQWHEYRGIPMMPTLHPAYVLRQYTEQNRRFVWEDLKAAHARSLER